MVGRYRWILFQCWRNGPLKVRPLNIDRISVRSVTSKLDDVRSWCNIGKKLVFSSTKPLWNVKNTKNKVPKSDIEYISVISVDFDGKSTRFLVIFAHLRKNPYLAQTRKSENEWKSHRFPIKIDRDHRDIVDIGSRDLFFRVFQPPNTFSIYYRGPKMSKCKKVTFYKKNVTDSKRYQLILIRFLLKGPLNRARDLSEFCFYFRFWAT